MVARIVSIIFAVNFSIFIASGLVIKPKLRILQPLLKCYKAWDCEELEYEKTKGRSDSDANDMKVKCVAMQEFDSCTADAIKAAPAPARKSLYLYAVIAYQTSYLFKRGKMCPNIMYEGVKQIVKNSGIMKQEKLSNIEDDDYAKCAGDALKECFIGRNVKIYKHLPKGIQKEFDYVKCMENEAKTCQKPIMRHLLDQIKAYKKHVKKLIELGEAEGY